MAAHIRFLLYILGQSDRLALFQKSFCNQVIVYYCSDNKEDLLNALHYIQVEIKNIELK